MLERNELLDPVFDDSSLTAAIDVVGGQTPSSVVMVREYNIYIYIYICMYITSVYLHVYTQLLLCSVHIIYIYICVCVCVYLCNTV